MTPSCLGVKIPSGDIMELKGKVINFLGDSITEGLKTSCEDARFSNIIARKTGAMCNNYGISGTKISLKAGDTPETERMHRSFVMRYTEMEKDADIIVVMGGTNDCGAKIPFGDFDTRDEYTFYGALRSLYEGLINMYPESVIVVMAPPHYLEEGHHNDSDSLRAYVDVIKEVAAFYGLPLLDLYSTSGLQPKVDILKEKYMPDGCHPNDEGHKILASKILAFLKNM